MIIAVDFDGTLCRNNFPLIGAANHALIQKLIEEQAKGAKLILNTCRTDDSRLMQAALVIVSGKGFWAALKALLFFRGCSTTLTEAVEWCERRGLVFDAVNQNLPEMIEYVGNDCRKIFANRYEEDRDF